MEKIMNGLQRVWILLCFGIFLALNYMFCLLYCGEVSNTSWLFSVFWALVFCGILELLPVKVRKIVMVILVTFFALSTIVHAVMYHLFGHFFSFSDLSYTGDGAAFFSFSYLQVRKLLVLTVIVVIAFSLILAKSLKQKKYSYKNVLVGVLLIVVGCLGIYRQHSTILNGLSTTLAWDAAGQTENDADIYQNMTNKNYAMSQTGIYQYLYRSLMVSTGWENRLNNSEMYDQLDEYYAAKEEHQDNEMTGVFEGKNVFFIMLESVDTWLLTEEFMPNLYGVQQESMDFVNHYSPLYISAGTFNTEFIANTSLVPPTAGIDTKVYKTNDFTYSLANVMKEQGYVTNSFHSSNPNIYNRGEIHENLGYKKYHNWVDMNMEDYMLDSQMIEGYSKMVSEDPFLSFIITYSGHGPYTDAMSNISEAHIEKARELVKQNPIDASKADLEEYTYAIAHAMETDAFIGELMQRLEQDSLLEDTVLVFFTDHYGKYMTNHELLLDLKDAENSDMLCNTPFFIYSKDQEPQKVETISSTVDILPTLANVLALETKYEYYTGVDLFSQDEEHYVIFQGNNWYDGEIYYMPEYTGEVTDFIRERNKEVSQKMKMSEYTLKSDYFKYLKSK